ncbi:MAG TPA: MFS transporter [Acidimicrobiales bacterium]
MPLTASAPAEPRIVDGGGWRERLLVPELVAIGLAVAVVSSLGSPMVPTVADEYDVSLGTAQWGLTAALLAGAVVTPVLGRLADGRYRRQVILAALGAITAGGAAAALPLGFGVLLLGRTLQGVGLGLMPMAMAVARDHLRPERGTRTVAALSVTTATGVGIGYPLSGLLVDTVGLRATFAVSAAVTGLVMLGAAASIPVSDHRVQDPVDVPGALTLAVGVSSLVVALSQLPAWGAASPPFVGLLVLAAAALAGFVRRTLGARHPLVDLRSLSVPSVRVAHTVAVLAGVGMYFLFSLAIRYVQTPVSTGYGQGRTVLAAGLILTPFSIASLAVNRLSGVVRRRIDGRWLMPLGCAALAAAMVVFGAARSEVWQLVVVMVLAGVGIGTVFAAMPQMIVAAVPASETGSALGFNQVLRTIGSSVGSAASAAVLAAETAPGTRFPLDRGYTTSAVIGMVVWLVALATAWPRSSLRLGPPSPELARYEAESVDAEVAGAVMYEPDPARQPTERGGAGG